jgi:hypothetical protein
MSQCVLLGQLWQLNMFKLSLTCHKHYLLVYSCLIGLFVKGEKLVPHAQSIIIVWPKHVTKRKHRSDSVSHAYAWYNSLFTYFLYLRTLRNMACARLLLCYVTSRNITIREVTISVLLITNGPTDINIAQILHLSNFLNWNVLYSLYSFTIANQKRC